MNFSFGVTLTSLPSVTQQHPRNDKQQQTNDLFLFSTPATTQQALSLSLSLLPTSTNAQTSVVAKSHPFPPLGQSNLMQALHQTRVNTTSSNWRNLSTNGHSSWMDRKSCL